jgi:surfactin family lipopeptide synthetase C
MKNVQDIYPLSPMQHGILFHSLYAPRSGIYHQQVIGTLCGDMDIPAFIKSWQRVVDRHGVLRTLFIWSGLDEPPLQIVRQRVELPWEQQDWRNLSLAKLQERMESFLQADRESGFELSQAPLMRLALLQVSDDAYQFVWSHHHLLLDGWSVSLVLKEVFAFYEAFCRGQDLHLEGPRPYRDYISWLQQQDLSKAEIFWRKTLQGFTAAIPLEIGRGPGVLSDQVGSYDEQSIQLSVATTAALRSFARQHRLTLNTLVQGAWALLLSRYSGREDVIFGVTVSGRPIDLAGVESMVGLLINTLPMRVQVLPGQSLLPWLMEMQIQQVEAREYDYTPLVKVQEWSQVPRGTPLFESILVFENYSVDDSLSEQGRNLGIRDIHSVERANYPLTLVAEPGAELFLQIIHSCHRFDTATVSRMLEHLRTFLKGIISDPHRQLSDIPMLTDAEQHQALVTWNDTKTEYPRDQCVHKLFEEQTERTPDAVAVVLEDEHLTYRELNLRANQLAHYLRACGVRLEVRVGICVERSVEMIVGLLGILKTGGVYVPLDPEYPQKRLLFMLMDARVSVMLTQQRLIGSMPEYKGQVICLDAAWESIAECSVENLGNETSAENLAYVMYTSGSTGTPKGISVPHRGVVRLVKGTNYANMTKDEIFLQFAPISFDASTFEIWGPLLNGGRLVVFPAGVPSMAKLGDVLKEHQVTTLWLTAGLFHIMVDEQLESLRSLQQLLAGGDVLSVPHSRRVLEEIREGLLINGYGPTENTTFTCCYSATDVDQIGSTVPIGRPVANTIVYVLDRNLNPVPFGIPGELFVGGDGLARGYINRPHLTAEKFIPNPFGEEPGGRLYRTGDLVRYLPDGNIEFLGRIDHQVKIRGFRVELGEIETALGRHPAVGKTVVLAREHEPGNKRLVAYVVPTQGQAVAAGELRGFLKERLPGYMVPSVFVTLDALPLTPNGKVDRQVLPEPDGLRPELTAGYVAPQTEAEQMIAGVWQDVLQVEKVGIYDNFFDLGGHSLLAIQVHGKLQDLFKREISVVEIFRYPTVSALAAYLGQEQSEQIFFQPTYDRAEVRRKSVKRQRQLRQQHQTTRKRRGEDLDG